MTKAPPLTRTPGTIELRIGHSPDPDDVFMWWPITGKLDPRPPHRPVDSPLLDTARFRYTGVPADIEALNRRANAPGDLEITAMSVAAFAGVSARYTLTSCGMSMGRGYGPKLVARADAGLTARDLEDPQQRARLRLAIPGARTSAFLALSLMLGLESDQRQAVIEMPFDQIVQSVRRGDADVGLIIHQSQLAYVREGLVAVADVGAWWTTRTGLPLPLGANAVRRDLDERFGPGTTREVVSHLRRSIDCALARRTESLEYALRWAPELTPAEADRYIEMYVNDLTVDAGEPGREAIARLLGEGTRAGLLEPVPARALSWAD